MSQSMKSGFVRDDTTGALVVTGGSAPTYVADATAFAALVPTDGMEIYFAADAANGVIWHLRYRAASASAYKWEFIGGAELFAEVVTNETTASSSYVDLTTVGPAIALPLAGDYEVMIGAELRQTTANDWAIMSYAIGGTAASDNDATQFLSAGANTQKCGVVRTRRKTGLTAVTLTMKYKNAVGGTAAFENRWMRARPLRVG